MTDEEWASDALKPIADRIDDLRAKIQSALEEVTRLREALMRWGRHDPDCKHSRAHPDARGCRSDPARILACCTCGLAAALLGVRAR